MTCSAHIGPATPYDNEMKLIDRLLPYLTLKNIRGCNSHRMDPLPLSSMIGNHSSRRLGWSLAVVSMEGGRNRPDRSLFVNCL